jgi:hypothetical protein
LAIASLVLSGCAAGDLDVFGSASIPSANLTQRDGAYHFGDVTVTIEGLRMTVSDPACGTFTGLARREDVCRGGRLSCGVPSVKLRLVAASDVTERCRAASGAGEIGFTVTNTRVRGYGPEPLRYGDLLQYGFPNRDPSSFGLQITVKAP